MNKLAVIVLSVGLLACSRKKPEEGREPAQTTSPAPVVGSATGTAPVAPSAPGSAAAGSAEATGSAAAGSAAAAEPASCSAAATLTCDAGQVDGCTTGLTTVHVCVAKDAKAGQPCAQELALTCPAGQVDGCLHTPPYATSHLCVSLPKSSP